MEQQLPQFGLTVRRRKAAATLALRGELDLHGVEDVRSAVAALFDQHVERIELDAGELGFVDSAGFKALLDVLHDGRQRGVEVEVVAASQRLRWLVQITGVDSLLPATD